MEQAELRNETPITELILLGFGDVPELQTLLFLLFLMIYILAVFGNLLIVVLVVSDEHLHSPMYYLVANLSGVEISYVSTTLPRLLASLLTGDRSISLKNCIMQFDVYGILSTLEPLLLTAMCYDRYLAICHPLRYAALMNGRVCGQLVAGCWISSLLICTIVHIFMLQLSYCGPKEIDHFFCDFIPIKVPFCGVSRILHLLPFVSGVIVAIVLFLLALTSYISVLVAILRIPSSRGRQKGFSTCSSHLTVVTIYYVSLITIYVVPHFNPPAILHKILSILYAVVTPLINPVIYCLRNKEVKESMRKAILKLMAFRNKQGVAKDKF